MLLFCHVYILIWESNELCVHGIWKGITFTGWLSCVWLFCGLVDCSLLGASVYWTSQARRLDWLAISFSRGSSQPRDRTCVPHTGKWILYCWATREAPPFGKQSQKTLRAWEKPSVSKRKEILGNFLLVQRLGLGTFITVAQVHLQLREQRSCKLCGMVKKKKKERKKRNSSDGFYHIHLLAHIHEFLKFIDRGEGGTNWESNTDI